MNKRSFRLLVNKVLRSNPELVEGEPVDDLYATLDSTHSAFGFNFYVDPPESNKVTIEADVPVPASQTDKYVKEFEKSGYEIVDIHHHGSFDGDDIHAAKTVSPMNASDAVSKALEYFESALNRVESLRPVRDN